MKKIDISKIVFPKEPEMLELIRVTDTNVNRTIFFSADRNVVEHLSRFGKIFQTDESDQRHYGENTDWRLLIDRRYSAEEVLDYIYDLKNALENAIVEE